MIPWIILNVDVEGLTILGLDPLIPKVRIVQNVRSGLDPVIPKGRIIQNFSSGLDPIILKGRIVHNVSSGIDLVILKGRIIMCMYVFRIGRSVNN